MIKAILFDMDGTLVDSEKYYTQTSFDWALQYRDVKMSDIYKIVGANMDKTYSVMAGLTGLDYNTTKESYNSYLDLHPMDYSEYLFDDVKEVLPLLSSYKLGVCTLSSRWMLDKFITDCKLNNFDLLLSDDDVKNPKPNPEIYLTALDRLNIKKDEAIVVEDSSSGIEAGKSAGIFTIARNGDRFSINQEKADYIFDDLHEILGIINERNN